LETLINVGFTALKTLLMGGIFKEEAIK